MVTPASYFASGITARIQKLDAGCRPFSLHLLSEHALLTGKNFPANYLGKKAKGTVQ
jgi:hypothetical protein